MQIELTVKIDWDHVREQLGLERVERLLAHILRIVEMTDAKISDLQPVVNAIADELPTISSGVTAALALIQQLQANSANPGNTTVLSATDQAAANDMLAKLTGVKSSLDTIISSITPASTTTAPTTAPVTGASGTGQAGTIGAPPASDAAPQAAPAAPQAPTAI